LSRSEKVAAFVGILTSLSTLIISIIELPQNPAKVNTWLALFASLLISILLSLYWKRATKRSQHPILERSHKTEEKRLRSEFPAIFTFIENVGVIRSQRDFDQFLSQLNHLLEIERRARGIKWSEIKDIESMKAIAYAKLISKRDSGIGRQNAS
jgi:hypothetical protein